VAFPRAHVYCEKYVELPGWYRPEKKWDLLIVSDGKLLAGIEFKSQVGSFGNNYNNRTEEAIGSATDIWDRAIVTIQVISRGGNHHRYWDDFNCHWSKHLRIASHRRPDFSTLLRSEVPNEDFQRQGSDLMV
jgi:hypothetical protein